MSPVCVVAICAGLVLSGVAAVIVLCAAMSRGRPEFAPLQVESIDVEVVYHDMTPLNYLPLAQLLMRSQDSRTELARIERAVCASFGIEPGGSTPLHDQIWRAVRDGEGGAELLAEHNRQTFGTRWDSRSRHLPYFV
ncbi:MAG: hypothetical protein U0892_20845 [Pirellulales bacterium]